MSAVDDVARARISSHETECARRYGEITGALGGINESIDKLFDRFWLAALGLIGFLLSLCGFLAYSVLKELF